MSAADPNDALSRLLAVLHRSLPMFLGEVGVWTRAGDERIAQTLAHITADQKNLAKRAAELLLDRVGRADVPQYPIGYADAHFLSLDSLVERLIGEQRSAVATIDACCQELTTDAAGKVLAEEALGASKAHLESLEELAKQTA